MQTIDLAPGITSYRCMTCNATWVPSLPGFAVRLSVDAVEREAAGPDGYFECCDGARFRFAARGEEQQREARDA
jgi:hypothetical protein